MKLKVGDIVKLKDLAVKEFFGTNTLVSLYETNGNMTSDGFTKYVADTLAFHDGQGAGVILEIKDKSTAKVTYFSDIIGWRTKFYQVNDLDLVKKD